MDKFVSQPSLTFGICRVIEREKCQDVSVHGVKFWKNWRRKNREIERDNLIMFWSRMDKFVSQPSLVSVFGG